MLYIFCGIPVEKSMTYLLKNNGLLLKDMQTKSTKLQKVIIQKQTYIGVFIGHTKLKYNELMQTTTWIKPELEFYCYPYTLKSLNVSLQLLIQKRL